MKNRWTVSILCFILVCLVAGVGYANNSIKIIVDGKEVISQTPPQLINDRVMVPIRFVAEALDTTVQWDDIGNSVIINSKPSTQPAPYNLLKLNGELTTWPYWYEGGILYLEYRNTLELIKAYYADSNSITVAYNKETSYMTFNKRNFEFPAKTKGGYKVLNINELQDNEWVLNFKFDPNTSNLTFIKKS